MNSTQVISSAFRDEEMMLKSSCGSIYILELIKMISKEANTRYLTSDVKQSFELLKSSDKKERMQGLLELSLAFKFPKILLYRAFLDIGKVSSDMIDSIKNYLDLLKCQYSDKYSFLDKIKTSNVGSYRILKQSDSAWESNLILTATTAKNFDSLACAVLSMKPVIIQGKLGCGKSFLLQELSNAWGLGPDNIVEVQINDQTDCKSMIGSYVCSDVPGEFVWQAGIITEAVVAGKWLVIEDVERVPLEFIAIIAQLLEFRKLYIPNRNSYLTAHPNFRIFGTRIMNAVAAGAAVGKQDWVDYNSLIYVNSMRHFSYLWHYVTLQDYSAEDIQEILTRRFPAILPALVQKLLTIFSLFNDYTHISTRESRDQQLEQLLIKHNLLSLFRLNTLRRFTLRELLLVASRINVHAQQYNNAGGHLTDEYKRIALQEVIDVFASSVRDRSSADNLTRMLGDIWEVAEFEVEAFFLKPKPKPVEFSAVEGGSATQVRIGRVSIPARLSDLHVHLQAFAYNKQALRMIEKVAMCTVMNEPVLLVGETGSGKTTTVQELANLLQKQLIVQNLSLSTDVSDLLGGYRPVTVKQLFLPVYEQFVRIFQETLSSTSNTEYLQIVAQYFQKLQWKKLLKAFAKAAENAAKKLSTAVDKAIIGAEGKLRTWQGFQEKIQRLEVNLPKIEHGFAFAYVNGLLLEAMRCGHWILLDEINLATSETLQGITGIFNKHTIYSNEGGHLKPVARHPDFRIFAAMNPPTDIGKKELPLAIRSRFTEIYSDEMTNAQDLMRVVEQYVKDIQAAPIKDIVDIYLGCRSSSDFNLTDSEGQRPRFSLRSLTRSLRAAKSFMGIGIKPFSKALFEAFLLNFQTLLSEQSRQFMWTFLKNSLYPEGSSKDLSYPPARPGGRGSNAEDWVLIKPYWLKAGKLPPVDWAVKDPVTGISRFVLTKTVVSNIRELTAGIAAEVAPILIQGPTSVGKTTMIEYIAARTGHKCIRINNHEHTDVQEYIGGYVTNASGHLEFKDGLLVEALRHGYWIILDELNLAPSDVLEALNRLLDDNQELYIPETGETIKPKAGFTLFATQNPAGIYGGRKPLSRAFRNRFLELSVIDLPLSEVETIVTESCGIAPKFSQMLVKTMQELQIHRQKSALFQGKYGSVTVRDLIKWGRRKPCTALEVAQEGYMLLAEKIRSPEEQGVVIDILNAACKVKLDVPLLYELPAAGAAKGASTELDELVAAQEALRTGSLSVEGVKGVAMTASMRRMWKLVSRCLSHSEPALLIGETGCGKTTVCQILTAYRGQKIRILNCHQSTETSDIIGGLRPVRGREAIREQVIKDIAQLLQNLSAVANSDLSTCREVVDLSSTGAHVTDDKLKAALDEMAPVLEQLRESAGAMSPMKRMKITDGGSSANDASVAQLVDIHERAQLNWQRSKSLFEWHDGPLITAMKEGDVFLLDEINLAEDAVIERLNSVLESGREITLAEKGGVVNEKIVAHPRFQFVATMNPGGDFGKRELSPALRSRFTEIWIPNMNNAADIVLIVTELMHLRVEASQPGSVEAAVASAMIDFMQWINRETQQMTMNGIQMSVRDVLAWAKFVSLSAPRTLFDVYSSYIHGAHMLILDGLGIGMSIPRIKVQQLKDACVAFLLQQCPVEFYQVIHDNVACLNSSAAISFVPAVIASRLTVGSFSIPVGPHYDAALPSNNYVLTAKNTTLNLGRILRAMQLPRPILLEGPPGVGKTSLISNLARLTGNNLVRINLSEHSEISDLLGTDLPAQEEDAAGQTVFKWFDGVFLTAMKNGDWVLLDELNLAPQTILEGLNACFDHREEMFIPEIGKVINCAPSFRVFCAQNPMVEGGGRKGLPQSFLSRFSRVFVEAMTEFDLLNIVTDAFSNPGSATAADAMDTDDSAAPLTAALLPPKLLPFIPSMVRFVQQLQTDIVENGLFGRTGGPWEFNLRDLFRWCELLQRKSGILTAQGVDQAARLDEHLLADTAFAIFSSRMRTAEDRKCADECFQRVFGFPLEIDASPAIQFAGDSLLVGTSCLPIRLNSRLSNSNQNVMEVKNFRPHGFLAKTTELLAMCVEMRWPALLIGPTGSCRRKVIQFLAEQTGHHVVHFSVSTSTDSSELLGSFEQKNAERHLFSAYERLEAAVMALVSSVVACGSCADVASPISMLSRVSTEIHEVVDTNAVALDRGTLLKGLMEELIRTCVQAVNSGSWPEGVAARVQESLQIAIKHISAVFSEAQSGFEWIDGVVVRALKEGHWLVIDNTNLCSASVLDRLNSLLEPNGSLLLTENGMGEVIRPHSDFRIFFVMDPSLGEISRAMRNRCVEIAFLPAPTNELMQAWQTVALRQFPESVSSRFCSLFEALASSRRTLPDHFPRGLLFENVVDLAVLHVEQGRSFDEALSAAVEAVLPKFDLRDVTAAQSGEAGLRDFQAFAMIALERGYISSSLFAALLVVAVAALQLPEGGWFHQFLTRYAVECAASHVYLHGLYAELRAVVASGGDNNLAVALGYLAYFTCTAPIDPSELVVCALAYLKSRSLLESFASMTEIARKALKSHRIQSQPLQGALGLHLLGSGGPNASVCMSLLETSLLGRSAALLRDHAVHSKIVNRKSNASQQYTLYEVAFAVFFQHVATDSRELSVIHSVFAIVQLVDTLLSDTVDLLLANSEVLASAASLADCIRELFAKRDSLTAVMHEAPFSMNSTALPWNEISVGVHWIHKALKRLCDALRPVMADSTRLRAALHEMQALLTKIMTYWRDSIAVEKLRLWKDGGHAAVPIQEKDWAVMSSLREAVQPFFSKLPGFLDTVVTSNSNNVMKQQSMIHELKEWLCLYATFYWGQTNETMLFDSASSSAGNAATAKVFVEDLVGPMKQKLQDKYDSIRSIEPQEVLLEAGADELIVFNERIAADIMRELAHGGQDSVSILAEGIVTALLTQLSHELAKNPSRSSWRKLHSLASTFLHLLLRHTSFNPALARELQTLFWCVDSLLSSVEHSEFELRDLAKFTKLRQSLLVCLERTLYMLSSRNLANAAYCAQFTFDSPTLELVINSNKLAAQQERSSVLPWKETALSGIAKQFQVVSYEVLMRHMDLHCLFAHYRSNKAISRMISTATAQLSVSTRGTAKQRFLQLFRLNVCAANQLQDSNIETVGRLNVMAKFVGDIVRSCRDNFTEDAKASILAVVDQQADSFMALFHSLRQVPWETAIRTTLLKDLFSRCMVPLLDSVCSLSSPSMSYLDSMTRIGSAWVHVGVLRLQLVTPAMPIDPAVKPTIKAKLLRDYRSGIVGHLSVAHDVNALAGNLALSCDVVHAMELTSSLAARARKLDAQSIHRPADGASFIDLYHELHSIVANIASSERLLALLHRLQECQVSMLKPKGREAAGKVLQQLMQEEISWQSSVFSFIEHLERAFVAFEDITSPVVSSLANISNGLRTVAAFTHQLYLSNDSSQGDPVAQAWSNIATFPVNIGVKLHANQEDVQAQVVRQLLSIGDDLQMALERSADNIRDIHRVNSALVPSKKTIDTSLPHVSLLLTLSRIEYALVNSKCSAQKLHELFNTTTGQIIDAYLTGVAEKKRVEAEKAALYKNKVQESVYTSNEEKEEEEALLKHFPQHLTELTAITERDKIEYDDGYDSEEEEKRAAAAEEGKKGEDVEAALLFETLDDNTSLAILQVHSRMVFFHNQRHVACRGVTWRLPWLKSVVPSLDCAQAVFRYSLLTAKTLQWSLSKIVSPSLMKELRPHSLLMLSSMCGVDAKIPVGSKLDGGEVDRDLLFLLQGVDSEHLFDFQMDPCPSEVMKATKPLQLLFKRASELLLKFPGNEFLLQVCRVAGRISTYHLTTSLGKMLISLEFLLKTCQEWEQYAASHVSLRAEMTSITSLIHQWRTIELKSWEHLLRTKEISYCRQATQYWFTLMRIFTSRPMIVEDPHPEAKTVNATSYPWQSLSAAAPKWLFKQKLASALKQTIESMEHVTFEDAAVVMEGSMTESEYFTKVFNLLDGYLRSSVVGEFPTRLHILRIFSLQLLQEDALQTDGAHALCGGISASLRRQLANITYGVWQYYHQFLPSVRRFQELLKGPIQKKLKDEIKIGKWDELNTYAMIEHSERIHRKLNKFLREYQGDVLDYPVAALLKREIMSDFVSENGELVASTTVPTQTMLFPAALKLDHGIVTPAGKPSMAPSKQVEVNAAFVVDHSRLLQLPSIQRKMHSYLDSILYAPLQAHLEERDEGVSADEMAVEATQAVESSDELSLDRSICHGVRASSIAESLCEDIFDRLAALREEGVTKSLKHRAILDLLTGLKEQGVSNLRSTVPADLRLNLSVLNTTAPLACEYSASLALRSDAPKELLDRAESYYMKNVVELTQLRVQSTSVMSSDVSARDVAQMMGFSENLFSDVLKLRSGMVASLNEFREFQSALLAIKQLQAVTSGLLAERREAADIGGMSELSSNVEGNRFAANIMVGNLAEMRIILLTAMEAQKPENLEENFGGIELLTAHQAQQTLAAFDDIIASLKRVSDDDDHSNLSDYRAGDVAPSCLESSAVCLSLHQTQKRTDHGQLLKKHVAIVDAAVTRFRSISAALSTLISADAVAPLQARFEELSRVVAANIEAPLPRSANAAVAKDMCEQLNALLDQSMVTVQNLRKMADPSSLGNSGNDRIFDCFGEALEAPVDLNLHTSASLTLACFSAFQLHRHTELLCTLRRCIVDGVFLGTSLRDSFGVLSSVLQVVEELYCSYVHLLEGLAQSYKSCSKLTYVCLRIFRTLLAKGICSDPTKDDDGEGGDNGAGGMTFQDNVEGTGMGEGEGHKDVSDQIQNEDQLMGLKEQKDDPAKEEGRKQQDKKTLSEEEKDTGVEMTQDFEGEYYDLPEEQEDQERQDEDEESKDDEEELEREMGEANLDDIVDEKQWNDEEDEADKEQQEKFEKESKAQGDTIEGEMTTRDDDNEEEEGGDEKGKDSEKKKEEDAQAAGENKQQQEEEEEDKVNEDLEDNYMDKKQGVDVRQEEQQQDDDEKEGDQGEEDGAPGDEIEGAPEGGEEPQEGDDLPDEMELDGDEDAAAEEQQAGSEQDDAADDEDTSQGDGDDEGKENEAREDEQRMQMGGVGDLPEQRDEGEKKEEEEEKQEDKGADARKDADEKQGPATYGVRSNAGKDSVMDSEQPQSFDDEADKDQEQQMNAGPKGQGGASKGQGNEGLSYEVGDSSADNDAKQPPRSRQREPPNPFKQQGDVNEKWHRRLNLVAPDEDAEQEEEVGGGEEQQDAGGEGMFEHARKEQGATTQVLADMPDEDKAMQLPSKQNEDQPQEQDAMVQDEEDSMEGKEEKKRNRQESLPNRKSKRQKREHDADTAQQQETHDEELMEAAGQDDAEQSEEDEEEVEEERGNEDDAAATEEPPRGHKVHTTDKFQFGLPVNDAEEVGRMDDEGDDEAFQLTVNDRVAQADAAHYAQARDAWLQHRLSTESYSIRLCEQLRLILEPTLAIRLQGDYRTGKRINMRKVISYIASGFRKDKIWLRRTKPAKRDYQVMIMIDDSKSMGAAGPIALSALATIANALTRLEVGELCVASFADSVRVLHPFGRPFHDDAGTHVISQFDFEAWRTMIGSSLEAIVPIFEQAKASSMSSASSGSVVLQICFVISDARIDSDNRERLDHVIRSMAEKHILVVLVIIDVTDSPKDSIFNTKSVSFRGDKVVTTSYFDDFPFPYYVAIQKLDALPNVLSEALKQWFELIRLQLNS